MKLPESQRVTSANALKTASHAARAPRCRMRQAPQDITKKCHQYSKMIADVRTVVSHGATRNTQQCKHQTSNNNNNRGEFVTSRAWHASQTQTSKKHKNKEAETLGLSPSRPTIGK